MLTSFERTLAGQFTSGDDIDPADVYDASEHAGTVAAHALMADDYR